MFRNDNYGTSTQYDDTDGWLDDVLGKAPKSIEPKTGFESEPLVYSSRKPRDSTCQQCMSNSILGLNVVFFIFGAAVIAFSLVMMKNDSWNTICTDCTNFFYFTVGLGGAIMVVSVIGILGSKCSKIALSFYTCFMIFAIIVQLGIIILVILLSAGEFMDHFGGLWRSAVKSDSHAVCDVQHSLNCSGWDTCCDCLSPLPPPPSPNNTLFLFGNSTNDCPSDCEYNVNVRPCKDKIKDEINDNLPWIMPALGVILMLFVTCLVFSCLMRKRYNKSS
eukprot:TRINITY_DN5162_c0_g1_i1.p1 TRINITY_DN5162_c0_g1~~TRINITY_DN5162_c0_g1_i1.p1  ORF type:complete len:276 (+),score=27.19 TRINITY_DN5162_c0_g1_i1:111-938(+)